MAAATEGAPSRGGDRNRQRRGTRRRIGGKLLAHAADRSAAFGKDKAGSSGAGSKDGVIRVQGTRVSLETIVYAFDRGASPEEIIEGYPTLDLAATYAILAHVLENREEVDRRSASALGCRSAPDRNRT